MAKQRSTGDTQFAVQVTEAVRELFVDIMQQATAQGAPGEYVSLVWIGALLGEASILASKLADMDAPANPTAAAAACLELSALLSKHFPALPASDGPRLWTKETLN